MSLFEYAQEVISRKLEKRPPMLRVSMDYMPTGGLSSIQQNLNINGQPHTLSYITPEEGGLLKAVGGSGEEVNGIPSYYVGHGAGEGTSEEGATGPGEDTGSGDSPGAGGDDAGGDGPTKGGPDTFDIDAFPDISPTFDPESPNFVPYFTPKSVFEKRALHQSRQGVREGINVGLLDVASLVLGLPLGMAARALGIDTPSINIGASKGVAAYGDTYGDQSPDDSINEDDYGGDDYIIKKKIAAFKNVPIEEVTAEEVRKVKRLTNEQRVADTGLEDILNQIYGPGSGAPMLGFNSDLDDHIARVN
jgi:hypothetical protein